MMFKNKILLGELLSSRCLELAKNAVKRRSFCERRIGEMNREIDQLVDGIAKGRGDACFIYHGGGKMNDG